MNCVKRLWQRVMVRECVRQAEDFKVRVDVRNGYTALGIPVTKAARQVHRGDRGSPAIARFVLQSQKEGI